MIMSLLNVKISYLYLHTKWKKIVFNALFNVCLSGTGLLSMMAAAEGGCESIVACEEFRPMAECASKIMQLNGFKDDIKLVRYLHIFVLLFIY